MRKNHLVSKAGKTVLCAVLTAAMVVPANLAQIPTGTAEVTEAEAADDLPEPIMTLDFEQGFAGEAKKNGFEVKKYDGILQFEEVTDEKGNYKLDADGNYIYELDYDKPFVEAGDYKYGTDGNQPTTYYDPDFGNTLMLDSTKINKKYIKTVSDELDKVYPVYEGEFDESGNPTGTVDPKSVLQEEITTHSTATVKNPYAGMDLSEEPTITESGATWTKGISISYWVKAGVNERTEKQTEQNIIKNDSILFTFQNDSREYVYNENDLMKYEACEAYTACVTNGQASYTGEYSGTVYTADDFKIGEITTITGTKTGSTTAESYQVMSGYGKLVRLNPDYPGSAENLIYFNTADFTGVSPDVIITTEDGTKYRLKKLGEQSWDEYSHFEMDASASPTGKGSKIKRAMISGSLSIAASNSFAFKEDDYTTKQVTDDNGKVQNIAIKGSHQDNPNDTSYDDEFYQMRHHNMVGWQGDGVVCEEDENKETAWHYVTCVIQNDWVVFYVDGVKYDMLDESNTGYTWLYSPKNGVAASESTYTAGKRFNKGYGLRAPLNQDNVDDWSEDGTLTAMPSNSLDRTMLEWISDPETVLMIGGQGSANEGMESQQIGTGDGTLLDDIKFYDVPLTDDQAIALYDEAKAEKEAAPAPTLLKKFTFDDDALNSMPAGMSAASTNGSGQDPYVVNDITRGHALLVQTGKASATSATVFENPYKGMELSGATVSYWYKAQKNIKGVISNSVCISFNDEPKILEHDKIQTAQKETATRTGLYTQASCDATFEAGYDTLVMESLKNKYTTSVRWGAFTDPTEAGYKPEAAAAQTEWTNRTNSFADWHYVTMVVTNAGITMYYDGQKLPNNVIDNTGKPAYYGPRFYDGYYVRVLDGFKSYKLASNNQGATPLMSFLAQDDTTASIGLSYANKSNKTFKSAAIAEYDDVAYYAGAATDEQVAAMYAEALAETKTAVAGEEVTDLNPGSTPTGDEKDKTTGTTDAEGNLVFESTKTGIKVTALAGSIDANAELVVTILGESDSAARYTNADSVLAGVSGLSVGKRVLYDIHFEVGGQTVQPSAPVTVELSPYSGYTADKCSVIYIDGAAVMTTSVSGGKLVFQTLSLGEFALVEAASGSAPVGNTGTNGNNVSGSANTNTKSTTNGKSTAGKTGDMANVLLPLLLLAAAAAALVYARRRKVNE